MKVLVLAFALITILISGCGGSDGDSNKNKGLLQIQISLPTRISRSISEIITLNVSVTASDMTPVSKTLQFDQSTSTSSGTFYVSAGVDRQIVIEALNSNGKVIYDGVAVVEIIAGQTNQIYATLSPTPYDVGVSIIVVDGPPGIYIDSLPDNSPSPDVRLISGHISGVDPSQVGVLLYTKKKDAGWYSAPPFQPLILADKDNKWSAVLDGVGQTDSYVAYLVSRDFIASIADDWPDCPDIPEAFAKATAFSP